MSSIKFKHSSGNSMSIAAPATNPASDLTLKLPATVGTAGQVLKNSSTAGTLEFGAEGVAEADQWRVTSNFSNSADPITSNWERNDVSFDKVGTGMSESSGIFTFPSTGIWKIDYIATFYATQNSNYTAAYLKATTNNSSYSRIGYTYSNIYQGSTTWYSHATSTVIFDVTDVSTHKVCLEVGVISGTNIMASTDYQITGLTFIRLGDT